MTKSYNEIVEQALIDLSPILDALAPYDTIEYEISEFILKNKDELRAKIVELYRPHHLFPDSIADVYYEEFANQALKVIQKECGEHLNLDQETILTISTESVNILDKTILSLPKESK